MGHTHRYQFGLKKKKSGKESQYLVSHPETGSDPPIGSDRESGCDRHHQLQVHKEMLLGDKMLLVVLSVREDTRESVGD